MSRSLLMLALLAIAGMAFAQLPTRDADVAAGSTQQVASVNFNRDVLSKMGIDQLLGNQVPGDVELQDEHGRTIRFGDLYGKRPLVVMPMFFLCKGICGIETDELLQSAIHMDDLTVGKDYDIVMLSLNPKENPELTFPRWKSTVEIYNVKGTRPTAEAGFHFLTGTYANVKRITDALGFNWVYDPKADQINHPAGLMALTPNGKVAGYIINKEFPITFLRHLVEIAQKNEVGPRTESILFGCIQIDHATQKRSIVIENVIRLCAAIFAIGVAGWIVGMSISGKKAKGGHA